MNPNSVKLRSKIEAAKKRSHDISSGQLKLQPIPAAQAKAAEMGYEYERALGRYRHRPALRFFKKRAEKGTQARTMTFLGKAVALAEQAGVSYELYVASQFYWFDRWFRRPPKIHELAGQSGKYPARRRLRDYLELVAKGQAQEVCSPVLPTPTIDRKELDKINEQRLEQLCIAWNLTETEIISQFGMSGIFDAEWLKRNPTFQQLRQERKLRV